MQSFSGFDRNNTFQDYEKLPAGCYELKILGAKVVENNGSKTLNVQFDIASGDFKDFYTNQYKANTAEDKKYKGVLRIWCPKGDGTDKDAMTIRSFNTNLFAIEDSNPGWSWAWDESQLKGKVVGGLFREREYEFNGKTGFFTECSGFTDIEKVRSGKAKTPKTKYLNGSSAASTVSADSQGFMNIPTGEEEELPF